MGSVGRRQEEIFKFTTHQFNESIYEDIDFKKGVGTHVTWTYVNKLMYVTQP